MDNLKKSEEAGGDTLREIYREFTELTRNAYEEIRTRTKRHAYRRQIFDDRFLQTNAEVFRQRAESLLFGKGDFAGAIAELHGAIEVFEDEADYHALLGLALFSLYYPKHPDKYREADERIDRARKLRPDSDVVYLCEGMIRKIEHRADDAVRALTQAARINSRNTLARIELESLKRAVTPAEREKAIGQYLNRHTREGEPAE